MLSFFLTHFVRFFFFFLLIIFRFEGCSSQVIELLTSATANFISTIGQNVRRELDVPGRVADVEKGAVYNALENLNKRMEVLCFWMK